MESIIIVNHVTSVYKLVVLGVLSSQATYALQRAGVLTVGELVALTPEEVEAKKYIGESFAAEIKKAVKQIKITHETEPIACTEEKSLSKIWLTDAEYDKVYRFIEQLRS